MIPLPSHDECAWIPGNVWLAGNTWQHKCEIYIPQQFVYIYTYGTLENDFG